MRRRKFLEKCGLVGAGVFSPSLLSATQSNFCNLQYAAELTSDIVIIGGGLGGCAAALASCKLGAQVILTEPTDWIGGQVSQQGVPPDEHQWIETNGGTTSYSKYRSLVREYYMQKYSLMPARRETCWHCQELNISLELNHKNKLTNHMPPKKLIRQIYRL